MSLNGKLNTFAALGNLNKTENYREDSSDKEESVSSKENRSLEKEEEKSVMPTPVSLKSNPQVSSVVSKEESLTPKPATANRVGRPVANTVAFSCRLNPGQPKSLKILSATSEIGDISAIVRQGVDIMTVLGADDYYSLVEAADREDVSVAELVKKAVRSYLKK